MGSAPCYARARSLKMREICVVAYLCLLTYPVGYDTLRVVMRTTIDIPDALYRSVRARTANEGTTLRNITIALYGDWIRKNDWHPQLDAGLFVITSKPREAQTPPRRRLKCFGIARKDANLTVSHDWKDIKKSIEEGWAQDACEKEQRIRAQ